MDLLPEHQGYRNEKPKLLLPKDSWVASYFGTDSDRRTIRGRAKLSKLVNLQEVVLPPGDLKIRLWGSIGITYLQGYTLRKTGTTWSAAFLAAAMPRFAAHDYKVPMSAPKSG